VRLLTDSKLKRADDSCSMANLKILEVQPFREKVIEMIED